MGSDSLAHLHDAVRRASMASDAMGATEVLRPLFADLGWLDGLIGENCAQMRDDPFALPPFSATRNGALTHLVLAASTTVMVAVSRIGGRVEQRAGLEDAPRVCFSGQQSLWRLLSDHPMPGRLARLERDGTRCRDRAITLAPGRTIALDERRLGLWLAPPERPAWLLRARIRRVPAPPMRTHALASGVMVARVQGDDAFARAVMLLGVVRSLGAADGFDAGLALLERMQGPERCADRGAERWPERWTVMRELVALDPARAWPHLEAMASDPHATAPVRAAARHVLARLAAPATLAPAAPMERVTCRV